MKGTVYALALFLGASCASPDFRETEGFGPYPGTGKKHELSMEEGERALSRGKWAMEDSFLYSGKEWTDIGEDEEERILYIDAGMLDRHFSENRCERAYLYHIHLPNGNGTTNPPGMLDFESHSKLKRRYGGMGKEIVSRLVCPGICWEYDTCDEFDSLLEEENLMRWGPLSGYLELVEKYFIGAESPPREAELGRFAEEAGKLGFFLSFRRVE